MPQNAQDKNKESAVRELFKAGAHFGFSRQRRHPSVAPFIFGFKNRTAVINLEETVKALDEASTYIKKLASEGKQVLFVGNKNEARIIIRKYAESIGMPYVAERWIGGTFTNFPEIKKRVKRLADIIDQDKKGELAKYTKKERGVIAKEKKDLERYFAGISNMDKLPAAIVLIDPLAESIALAEAIITHVPVVALAGSDCDINKINYPVVANDTQVASITLFIKALTEAYKEGKKLVAKAPEAPEVVSGATTTA